MTKRQEEELRTRLGKPDWAVKQFESFVKYDTVFSHEDGFVYFVAAENGPVKIGWTGKDAEARVRDLQVGNPYPLTLAALTTGGRRWEEEFHRWFQPWRMNGEWFDGGAYGLCELVAYFQISQLRIAA